MRIHIMSEVHTVIELDLVSVLYLLIYFIRFFFLHVRCMHNEQDATMLPNALFSLCDESQAQPEATELREEI